MPHAPTNPQHVCATCHHYGELVSGSSVWCVRPGQHHVNACGIGCVFWEREPGADDEIGWPPATVEIAPAPSTP